MNDYSGLQGVIFSSLQETRSDDPDRLCGCGCGQLRRVVLVRKVKQSKVIQYAVLGFDLLVVIGLLCEPYFAAATYLVFALLPLVFLTLGSIMSLDMDEMKLRHFKEGCQRKAYKDWYRERGMTP